MEKRLFCIHEERITMYILCIIIPSAASPPPFLPCQTIGNGVGSPVVTSSSALIGLRCVYSNIPPS